MKKLALSLLLCLFSFLYICAEEKLQKEVEEWDVKDERSLVGGPEVILSDGFLCITAYNSLDALSIEIQTLTGETVWSVQNIVLSTGEQYPISINELPSGEYIVTLREGSNYAVYYLTK